MKHPQKVKGVLDKWIYPKLGKIHLADITAAHVVDCIENIINSVSPTDANDARRHIKNILRYGLVLGRLPVNVAADIDQDIAGFTEQARNRHLTISEIKKLFTVMEKNREWFDRNNELATRLLLMLGVRKNELIAATWSIPSERSKTKNGFTGPLPPVAIEYLNEIQIRACGSKFVFPSRRRGRRKAGYIFTDTLNAALHNLEIDIDPFTVHDLRRTMRTQLSALGIRYEVAERCLNHTLKGTARIYDQHDFLDDRRDALQRWTVVMISLDQEGIRAANNVINNNKIVYLRTAN